MSHVQPDPSVTVEVDERTYIGTYRVESGVVSVWTTGPDGVYLGPFTMVLRGMPAEVAARTLLWEYAMAHPSSKS